MNKVILIGRLCADPEVRYSQNQNQTAVARYRLAVDRRFKREGDQTADFIPCVAFGKAAQFAEYYLHRGTKIIITGRIQTGSYTNKDGQKIYTTDVVVEEQEFAESKNAGGNNGGYSAPQHNNPAPSANTSDLGSADGFMNIPDGIDEELPFNLSLIHI